MYIIGDVHGKWPMYYNLINKMDQSIQLGDMGVGFKGHRYPPHWNPSHVYFRGNHDNPEVCRQHPNCIGDFGIYEGIFFVAGAYSIDWEYRKEGASWWADEQLSKDDFEEAIAEYSDEKPEIVVTHECPFDVAQILQVRNPKQTMAFGSVKPNDTSMALNDMFRIHRPKKWIFGHWHIRDSFELEGTRFEVLPELGYIEI